MELWLCQDSISSHSGSHLPGSQRRDKESVHLRRFYYKAISPAAITHCLWCVWAMCRRALHSRDLRLVSVAEIWFINFIQIPDSTRWKHNLHDCCSKNVLSCSIWSWMVLNFLCASVFEFNRQSCCCYCVVTSWEFAMAFKPSSPLCVSGCRASKHGGRCKYPLQITALILQYPCLPVLTLILDFFFFFFHTFATVCMQIPAHIELCFMFSSFLLRWW